MRPGELVVPQYSDKLILLYFMVFRFTYLCVIRKPFDIVFFLSIKHSNCNNYIC